MSHSLPAEIARLKRQVDQVKKGQRLSHGASLENAVLEVKDDTGSLRTLVGPLGDGSVGVQAVNGPPPPQPSAPIVTSTIGGVTAAWDGLFANGAAIPMDWSRIEVHASQAAGFEPLPETLRSTIETAQGATVVIPTEQPVYVRLVARNTSGTASIPSAQVGPFNRAPVVGADILDGTVTTLKLAESAVTAAKIAAGAVTTVALADGAILDTKLADNAVKVGKIAAGAVTLNTLGGALGDTASQRFADYFRDATAWTQLYATAGGTFTINTTPAGTPSGGGRLIATGEVQAAAKALIPQDSDTLYRVMVRVRATAQDPTGPATVYLGAVGVAEDGVTFVNRSGANSNTTQYYCCSAGASLGTAGGWTTYVGWIQGHAASPASGPATDPRVPEATHTLVRYLRPMVWLNFGKATSAVMEVEAVTVEAIRTGVVGSTNLISGSVTAGAIATDAVTAGKIAADAITARELAAGSVTASEVAAGAITTDKLTVVGGANILNDPSFEGAYGASIAAKFPTYASIDTAFGNGSTASLKIDATSVTAAYRAVELALVPTTPGDQVYIAVDYYASTDWAGAEINMQIRWEVEGGTILSYGKAATTTPTRGAWTRLSATVTAPATANRARIRVESGNGTVGAVWFDNAVVRPVVPGVQIADGAITTPKLVAGAVQANQIAAGSVVADKIASAAVTTAKLDALAVTADKIAANAITADKILAGSITATALSATAIDGKTITGSVVRTAAAGERITLNENDENMILVYNASGVAVGELSARGLGLMGSSGAAVVIAPDAVYPQLRWVNSAQSNYAAAQVLEPVAGDANLSIYCGQFAGSGYTDMAWRQYLARDAALIERLRAGTPTTVIGGRLALTPTQGGLWYRNTDSPALDTSVIAEANLATVNGGRLQVLPVASNNSAFYVEALAAHTGYLMRAMQNGVEKFRVDLAGNVVFTGMLSAGNIATGSVNIVPSAANTPTSALVTFPALAGTTFRGFATASTTVPGTRVNATPTAAGVTGVSTSSTTSTSTLVHVNRENTTSTTVNWMVIGA